MRWKNVRLALAIYGMSRRWPAAMRRLIRKLLERRLPPGFDIATYFSPRHEPWDQRMCIVPDGNVAERQQRAIQLLSKALDPTQARL